MSRALRVRGLNRGVLVCAAALVVVAAALYAQHVVRGGFAWDDWENAASTAFQGRPGFWGPLDLREAAYEPGLALLLPIPHLLFGGDPSWHLALAVALGIGMSLCLFALMRELGLSVLQSTVISVLSLAFPWSDSTRLWATGGLNQVAGCLYLLGALQGLRAVAMPAEERRSWKASALFAGSLATYPIAVVPVACSCLLYRLRVPWRAAWQRGRWDLALAVVFSVYQGLTTTKPVEPLEDQAHQLVVIANQSLTVLARSVLPWDTVTRNIAVVAVVMIGLAAWWVVRRRRSGGSAQSAHAIRRWLLIAGAAGSAVFGAYAVFAAGEPKYVPLAPGLYNRVGLLAGLAASVFAFAVCAAIAEALLGGRPGRQRSVSALACALSLAVLAGWGTQVRDHVAAWDQAAAQSRRILAAVRELVPDHDHGTVIYTTGHPLYSADGVPIFASSFDLRGALQMTFSSPSLTGYPLPAPLTCGRTAAMPDRPPYKTLERARYGRLYVVDVARHRAFHLPSQAQCRAVTARLRAPHGL